MFLNSNIIYKIENEEEQILGINNQKYSFINSIATISLNNNQLLNEKIELNKHLIIAITSQGIIETVFIK